MAKNHHLPDSSYRRGEQGNATLKFVLVAVAIFVIGYGGFHYIVTWYQCAEIQTAMKESIDRANMSASLNDKDPEKIRMFLRRKGNEYNMPADAVIKINKNEAGTMAQVTFMRDVPILPFNLYNYKYDFNHTVTPGGFFAKEK